MDIPPEIEQRLRLVALEILELLKVVSQKARELLRGGTRPTPANAFATPLNQMIGGDRAAGNLRRTDARERESLSRIETEPFVARMVVRWLEGPNATRDETIFVTRGSAASIRVPAKLASYTSPAGRLAEFEAGDGDSIRLGGRDREFQIVERALLRPTRAEEWDADANPVQLLSATLSVPSLRRFLETEMVVRNLLEEILAEGEAAVSAAEARRRRVVEKLELRDQPVLDRYQGEVFRLPISQQLLLLGPPGTGKTTTLIRRLSSKRNLDGLVEDERALLDRSQLADRLLDHDSWAMFAPTDLLSHYLRDAFTREGVPANPVNLRTWTRERQALARELFGLLRTAQSRGGFELDERTRLVLDDSSTGVARLHDEFDTFAERTIFLRLDRALREAAAAADPKVTAAVMRLRRRLGDPLSFADLGRLLDAGEIKAEADRVRGETNATVEGIVNRLLSRRPDLLELLAPLALRLRSADPDELEEEEEDDEASDADEAKPEPADPSARYLAARALMAALRSHARSLARGRRQVPKRAEQVLAALGTLVPGEQELKPIGERLLLVTELGAIQRSPRRAVTGLGAIYRRFRRERRELFGEIKARNSLSPVECDALLLVALRNARRLFLQDPNRLQDKVPSWLGAIRDRYLVQVLIDEVTDFSSVQLACMAELAHPQIRSWFACGDIRQRITAVGIREESEFDWVVKRTGCKVESRRVTNDYRQTATLRALTRALDGDTGSSPPRVPADEIKPLLLEGASGPSLVNWLAVRIGEVERALGRLPSIAVFVDGDEEIVPLLELLEPELRRLNISVVGCPGGRILGDRQEVRIFDVRHVKGLEFEACFFVSIDRLARSEPELFARFFYVGATRAATYLGVTCEGKLPGDLEPVRPHFSTTSWS